MTAVVQQQPGIAHMDPLNGPPSFSARKNASSNLPGRIELPSNPLTQKFGAPLGTSQHSQPSINNLLTPPSHIPGDSLSPISSSSNSASNTAANGVPPYTPTGYWQSSGSGLTPYINSASGSTPPSWTATNFPPPKGLFSPSLNSLLRNSNPSPPTTEGVQPPQYDLGALPPFPASLSPPVSLPGMAGSQHGSVSYVSQHHTTMPPQSAPLTAHDGYSRGIPHSPSHYYGSQSSTGSQPGAQYPPFSAGSPVSHSPGQQIPRMSLSPMNPSPQQTQQGFPRGGSYHHQQHQQHQHQHQPYGMPGPIMSNVHNPGQQMQLVGMPGMVPGFHSGHAANLQHMYGHPGASPQNDRPFKCDQCPQCFNRNHDLKRHKRIHLAVKPFPCGHCEKSFSRKDALKRHILVKGCGKASAEGSKMHSDSADEKDDDSGDEDSPMR